MAVLVIPITKTMNLIIERPWGCCGYQNPSIPFSFCNFSQFVLKMLRTSSKVTQSACLDFKCCISCPETMGSQQHTQFQTT